MSDIVYEELGVETHIEVAHRTGKKKDRPRHIIFTVSSVHDKFHILMAQRYLRDKNYFITEDLTQQDLERKRMRRPQIEKAKAEGRKWRFVNGKLYVPRREVSHKPLENAVPQEGRMEYELSGESQPCSQPQQSPLMQQSDHRIPYADIVVHSTQNIVNPSIFQEDHTPMEYERNSKYLGQNLVNDGSPMQASIQQPVAPKPHAYAQDKVNKQVVYAEVHNEDINEDINVTHQRQQQDILETEVVTIQQQTSIQQQQSNTCQPRSGNVQQHLPIQHQQPQQRHQLQQ